MAQAHVGPAGIETISGALSKPKKQNGHSHGNYLIMTHRKAASSNPNCQRVYSFDADRYKRTAPLSTKENTIRTRFSEVSQMVNTRAHDLNKITQDQAAFIAQKNEPLGKKTMRAYLWKVCGAEYDQIHG